MKWLLLINSQDEIDALGTSRSSDSDTGSAPSHEGVLTSLLNEMDGVQELVGVTIIAATNRPEVIVSLYIFDELLLHRFIYHMAHPQDSALMRPGRLDRILYVGPPDQEGREEILKIRTRKMSVEPGLDLNAIAAIVSTTHFGSQEECNIASRPPVAAVQKSAHCVRRLPY